MLPIGRSEESSVWTTNFKPGARLMTLRKNENDELDSLQCANY